MVGADWRELTTALIANGGVRIPVPLIFNAPVSNHCVPAVLLPSLHSHSSNNRFLLSVRDLVYSLEHGLDRHGVDGLK